MIRVRNLLVQRPAGILCRLASLDVERGERISVEGPNGSGKSTLLRVLAGLERDFEGDVDVAARGRDATFVHQTPLLFRGTVLANVLYGLRARHVPRRDALRRAQEMLERAELSTLANRRVAGLSGGERRRVALARAFVLEPQLLLLDEPLSDLDEAGARMLGRALDAALSATVLLTSPTGETGALAQRRITLTR